MSQPLFFIKKKKQNKTGCRLPSFRWCLQSCPWLGLDILAWLCHPAGGLHGGLSSVHTSHVPCLLCWVNVVGVIWNLLSPGSEWHRNVVPFVVVSFKGRSGWHLGVTLNEWKWGKSNGDLQWEICLAVYDYFFFPTMENEVVAFMLDKFLDSWGSLGSLAGTPAVLLQHEHPSVL